MDTFEDTIIDIDNSQDIIEITKDIEDIIIGCVNKVLDLEKFQFKTMVSIALTDNLDIREINLQFRDVDKETDVLSFPMLEIQPGEAIPDENELINDAHPETGAIILGDIVISMEKVMGQALEYGHSFERELGFLVVHGMLHLLGYDHIECEDRNLMRMREEVILKALNLGR